MTEQLFVRDGEPAPDGAVFIATDTLVVRAIRQAAPLVVSGKRFMVNWRILGDLIRATSKPVRLAQLNSGTHAYTQVAPTSG